MNNYQPVIGLEIHVELSTVSKMFCSCPADWFGKEPNTLTCPVCLGLPGALPVANRQAIEWVVKLGLAMRCGINMVSKFDRKHYFYPDLPKGFQISQYDVPFCHGGSYDLLDNKLEKLKTINIKRIHMEEDTGKLIHKNGKSYVDFNRCGVPLVEIVTEPDFENSTQVKQFLEELHTLVLYLNISDANMEEGSMRLEPNISIRKVQGSTLHVPSKKNITLNAVHGMWSDLPNYKVEVKNINSFKFAVQAIDYEIERQIEILKRGDIPPQETRGFDPNIHRTVSQRTKEEAHDYRYFPEPDIPPITLENSYVEGVKADLPELPQQKLRRYIKTYKLRYQDATILISDSKLFNFFEQVSGHLITGHKTEELKDENMYSMVANLIINKKISIDQPIDSFVAEAVKKLKPVETDEEELVRAIDWVINENANAVLNYKQGNINSIMFLVGQVMQKMKGKADAQLVRSKLEEALS
ncbi:hypothetical protein A2690_01370 [Candidatus Roizmanbacteria bacterium RIFCSPHIGHO2_01_FULL_39_12b]|uniref:Aspartyl/glutamyl-tRNA(Asn/Gln) amidotransferase subunit B n=1 Tax=Candidatus Roizmanbacteria bacterium RIFCSPHIGHO2_01_FULL_39_12b TaxID=1802030 RepID=A0A1F7GAX1_9BACT|nr:MAG: hypothetical protein A2690_01370 [Candidatus Roizmanbacteria bacterium RIFCSPHIGHO2_01_FULL_39_12b]OGK46090.1 MAG: hypothetical protein A3B46_01275 [Candidatus Roizmanbacteria bacterium RIFCSPLOWO2_01_FULL_39_19]